jgi:adenylate cyclase
VTVLFADIVAFTKFAEAASAEVLVGVLNDISTRFDNTADRPGLDSTRTIGDAYLAAVGLTDAVAEHSLRAAHMALDMIEAVDRFNERSRYKLKVRIGINGSTAKAGKHPAHFDL